MDYGCPASPFDQDEELEHEDEVLADARGEMQRQEGDEYEEEEEEKEEKEEEEEEEEEDYVEDEEPFAPPPAEQAGSSEQPWRNVPWQQLRADRTKRTRRSEPSDGDSSFGDGLDSHVNPGAARSAAGDEEDMFYDEEEEDDQRPEVITRRNTKVDADCFDDYNKKIMGHGVTQSIPEFKHSSSAWTKSADAKDFVNGTMRPIRTLVWNIPVGLFMKDAAKFRDWVTPKDNAMRAAHIAAVVSFCFTGLSKGFLSGDHEEKRRANGEAEEDAEQGEDSKKGPRRVYRYAFMLPEDNNVTMPMFTIAYEELYDPSLTEVKAIRMYKFIFDKQHSDSELCRQLLDENRDTFCNAGSAHAQNNSRRKNLLGEHKNTRIATRFSLEYFAGMQYINIQNESQWMTHLKSYSGMHNVKHNGRPFFDESRLPSGIYNKRITSEPVLGGTHPLSPEYVFNARREQALSAGLVDMDDELIEVHPDFLDPSKYWTDSGAFLLPSVSADLEGFFFVSDPYVTNVFDLALPRPIHGVASPGDELTNLFEDCHPDIVRRAGGSRSAKIDCFNHMMKEQDPLALEMQRLMAETLVAYDTIDVPDSMRKANLRHYGEMASDDSYVIEPEQFCLTLQEQTRRVLSKLIHPWLKSREDLRTSECARVGDEMDEDEVLAEVERIDKETTARHCLVMKDLIFLHLSRLEEAFSSRLLRESIPSGYKAMYDGMQTELAKMPNRTASIAWAFNVSLRFSDMSSFAHTNLWLGDLWEKDTFIEGRDRRIMDEMFLHFFEQYGEVTFLLLLCGYKGNGKTLRTERAQALFPPNWITIGGPGSAKAGQNGQSDATDGKNVVYDEMIDDLCESEGSDRLEYWKQIVLKREYTFNRTVAVKNPDGTETHRTMKLRTPHNETHLICTNYGMAFTKDRDPSDTKFAMIDRSIAHLVRSIGQHARTDAEFHAHIDKPEQVSKLTRFRIFVCLVGATKLAIKGVPDLQPNLALANKMFDYLDNQVIVKEYNLPKCTPRKCLKRDSNLQTMCAMKAVADVFVYKQTAVEFDAGRLDEDGLPQPFKMTMLYDVIRQMRATPELIFMAWSQSLDYNIGTAAHSMAAMTALCEHFKLQIGDWFKRPNVDNEPRVHAPPGSPTAGFPLRTADMTDGEWERAKQAYQFQQDFRCDSEKVSELPNWMDIGGLSREERLEMLKMYERQRRATSLYRDFCTLGGNTQLKMSNPVDLIEKVMERVGAPADLDSSQAVVGDCLPVYSSTIMASTVQTCSVYHIGAVLDWCRGGNNGASRVDIGTVAIGARREFGFSEYNAQGACRYNTAWLRKDAKEGLRAFAKEVSSHNQTCKIFDFPQNALRDAFYLLTTRDNSRRCTEEPKLERWMRTDQAFVDNNEGHADDTTSGPIRMRGISDGRGSLLPPSTEHKKRHPYSMVHDCRLQRQIDFVTSHGRLPAMMPMISNVVRDTPPVRIVSEGEKKFIEINTAAAHEHTKMLAEASVRCSVQPGLENLQEAFCGGAQGPDGLCIEGGPGGSDGSTCTRMAYSFDMVSIALTLDAMNRYFDSERQEYVNMYNELFAHNMGTVFRTQDLPHMSLRFVGYEDSANRRLLSVPVKESRDKAFYPVVVDDDPEKEEDFDQMTKHLGLSLGHDPSDDEIDRYLKSRNGSRSMSGVKGDLFDMATYLEHTRVTMKERGMVSGVGDVVLAIVEDDPYGLRPRVAEAAGRAINERVEKHPTMKAARANAPQGLMTEEQRTERHEREIARTRANLYKHIRLPPHLDELRDYASLNVDEVSTFTFHNMKRSNENSRSRMGQLERRRRVDEASVFKDKKRMREMSVPGRKPAAGPSAGPSAPPRLSCGGLQDGRARVSM